MSDMILDVGILPEPLFSHVKEETFDSLIGMFSDGRLSIDNFLSQKRLDTELKN